LTGDLAQGGTLEIEFDPKPLTQCWLNLRGAEVWDDVGYARFFRVARSSAAVRFSALLLREAATRLEPIPLEVPVRLPGLIPLAPLGQAGQALTKCRVYSGIPWRNALRS